MMRRVIVAGLLAAGLAGQEWPRLRGPNGSGVSEATGLPVEFSQTKNLLWRTQVPFGRSSPVIAGDRIFLTASEGEKLITLCLRRRDGRLLWRREIPKAQATPVFKTNDPASPTPATDGRSVYVFFPNLGLVSFTLEGKERWRLPLGPFDTFYGLGASPVVYGDTVYLLCDARKDGFLIAVDARTGRVRWRAERKLAKMDGWATPVMADGRLITLGAHRLDVYSAAKGEPVAAVSGLGYFTIGSPVVHQGMAMFMTFGGEKPMGPAFEEWLKKDADGDGKVSREEAADEEFGAIDRNGDGYVTREEWDLLRNAAVGDHGLLAVRLSDSHVVWRQKRSYDSIPTPVIYRDVLYMVKSGGIISSVNPATGEVHKTERAEKAVGTYYSSPVAANGKVYFTSEQGKVTVVSAKAEWEILAVNDLGEECYATPAIGQGVLYLRTRGAMYAFGGGK